MRGIIFIAPPTAGKGTQALALTKKYHFLHISTGDLLREEIKKNTPDAQYIKDKMANGELVDEHIVLNLLEEKLKQTKDDFILDGFPRNKNQAIYLDHILKQLNINKLYVIDIDIDEDVAKQRILGRMQCPKCKKIYNNASLDLKPIQDGICDTCHISLVKREDDNEQTIRNRFKEYLKHTKPLINYYEDKHLLYHVDGRQDMKEVFKAIEGIIGSEPND